MPHDKKEFPYIVVGSGIIPSENMQARFKIFHKIRVPIPVFYYARTKKKAEEIADKVAQLHETVVIAKIEKVVR